MIAAKGDYGMIWAANALCGIFAAACMIVLGRELARKHAKPDWSALDRLLGAVISGKTQKKR